MITEKTHRQLSQHPRCRITRPSSPRYFVHQITVSSKRWAKQSQIFCSPNNREFKKMITTRAAHAIKFQVIDGAEKSIENSSWPLLEDERPERPGSSASLQCLFVSQLLLAIPCVLPPTCFSTDKTCVEPVGLDPPASWQERGPSPPAQPFVL